MNDLSETNPARPAAYSCFRAYELAIILRQWKFAEGRREHPYPRIHAYDDKSVRNRDASFLYGEPGALYLEFARALPPGGDWRDRLPDRGAGSTLFGSVGPVANDSCRAV